MIALHPLRVIRALLLLCLAALPAYGQAGGTTTTSQRGIIGFFARWDERALQAQENQPNWLTPVVTSTARIKQELRYDMSWQWNNNGTTTDNYGGSRGLTTILLSRVEVSVNLPPYVVHNESSSRDGFGDFSILTKFRIAAANRKHGDYALTAFLNTSIPTGSYKNGSPHAVITPTIAGGKGLGDFVYEGSFGCDLPGAQTAIVGRRLILNNAFQYRRLQKLWPEFEVNSNFYNEGPNGGKKQVFVTPGVSAGRFVIYGHLQLTLSAGVEIAATHFHTFAHQGILSVRLPF
jgi:hypothetical protein